ncbi:MAG: RNA-binding domain-containing protein [Thermoprotei archaeon]
MKIHNVNVAFFIHETEDPSRVLEALEKCLPGIRVSDFVMEVAEGHHGNRIQLYKATLTSSKAREFFHSILNSLDKADLIFLLSTLDERMDKSRLHLRIDKQAMVADCKPRIKDGDDVVKITVTITGDKTEISEELSRVAQSH